MRDVPIKMYYVFDAVSQIKDRIKCLKDSLMLTQRGSEEDGVLILRNEDRTVRVDMQVSQDDDFKFSYNIDVSLERDEYKGKVLECLGEPKEHRIPKPTIIDVCYAVASKEYSSREELLDSLASKFNLSVGEVTEYFKRIISFSTARNIPEAVMEAIKVIKRFQ